MSDNLLSDVFNGLAKKLQADFGQLTAQYTHRATKGTVREDALRKILEEYLPKKFGIGSGQVISSDGKQSKQIDIVVYDALNTPCAKRTTATLIWSPTPSLS